MPNFLSLSPYQNLLSIKEKSIPLGPQWFLIQVLCSLVELSTFGNSKNIYFTSENMVADRLFKMCLNQDQYYFLKNSTYFNLYPISKSKKSILKSFDSHDCYVHASSDWAPPSGTRVISRISDTIFHVENLKITKEVLDDPRILSIRPSSDRQLFNRYNSGFLQTGHQKSYFDHSIFAPIRPLHHIGLDGTGEIVNVVDSGVDFYNAFFYDSTCTLDSITGKTNLNHRKIVRIEPYSDNKDVAKGHGTHVAGIVAGYAYCTKDNCGIAQYNGIAPGSKLYFSDIGNSTTGQTDGKFDLESQYQIFKELNVHVSTNSWGYSYRIPEEEFAYNKIAYNHPDVLYIFAAGNSNAYNSIYCPSNAKNILSIGSSEFITSSVSEFSANSVEIQNETISIEAIEFMSKIVRQMSISEKMKYFVNLSLSIYGEVSDPSLYKNTAVLLDQNKFEDDNEICKRGKEVEGYGASAAFYIPNVTYFRCEDKTISIPLIRITKENIDDILNMGKISILPVSGSEGKLPGPSYQSSKGPADSGLVKPELILPGSNVFSALSHGTEDDVVVNATYDSNIIRKSGSSMATPAAAALAAIMRQFLTEGYYPLCQKNSGPSVNPSSCLLKALLVNTAKKPTSLVIHDNKDSPRNDAGFGIPFLNTALGFEQDYSLRFIDNEVMPSNTHRVYTIETDSNASDLGVTLTYLDPPLDPDNQRLLFADLDLFVKAPSGKFYFGNSVSSGEAFSVIERVIIDKDEIPSNGGTFEIHVISSNYPIQNQKVTYSIVVNGPFEKAVSEKNPLFIKEKTQSNAECPNNCNGNGFCENGFCSCKDGFIGPSCNSTETIIENDADSQEYSQKEIKYFKLNVNDPNLNTLDFGIEKSVPIAPAYFCISFEKNPGKIANAGWDCFTACPQDDPESEEPLASCNFSFRILSNNVHLAVYTGYYQKVKIDFNNISFSTKDYDDEDDDVKNDDRKMILTVGIIILVIAVVVLIVMMLSMALGKSERKKENDINESLQDN